VLLAHLSNVYHEISYGRRPIPVRICHLGRAYGCGGWRRLSDKVYKMAATDAGGSQSFYVSVILSDIIT